MIDDVERVAIALAESRCWPGCWAKASDVEKSAWLHDARAAIAAMGKWEGIESAPRDGTAVMVACASGVRVAQHLTSIEEGDSAWIYARGHTDEGMAVSFSALYPTHWRPLPAPPEATHD